MNKELRDKSLALNQCLLNEELIKEYKKYEILVSQQPHLLEMENKLKDMQKEIVQKKHNGDDCQLLIDSYHSLKQEFNENPIIHNYLVLKEEVNELIQSIQNEINMKINHPSEE